MRRKDYHERLLVSVSVEKDRWRDFQELCDKERKSYSLKVNEMLAEELEKNALGVRETNPLNIRYHKQTEKPLQRGLDHWIKRSDAYENIKTMDPYFIENIGINMVVAARFKKTGIAREVKVI